jgi:hypothetical protein
LGGFYNNEDYSPFINPVNYKYFKKGIDDFSVATASGEVSFQITIDGGEK